MFVQAFGDRIVEPSTRSRGIMIQNAGIKTLTHTRTLRPPQLAASFVISNHRRDVAYWHFSDMAEGCPRIWARAECLLLMLWTAPPPARKCQGRRWGDLIRRRRTCKRSRRLVSTSQSQFSRFMALTCA